MTPEQFNDWLYYYSFMAGMSQQYYRIVAGWLWFFDVGARWATLILASLAIALEFYERWERVPESSTNVAPSLIAPIQQPLKHGFLWRTFSPLGRGIKRVALIVPSWPYNLRFTVWSAIFAAIVALVPLQEWRADQLSLLDRWSEVRADSESMVLDLKEDKAHKRDTEFSDRRQKLLDKVAKIEKDEVFEVPILPWYCHLSEEFRRGGLFSSRRVYIDKILEPDNTNKQTTGEVKPPLVVRNK